MIRVRKILALSTLVLTLSAGAAFAQGDHYVRHNEWKKGAKINQSDWNRGQQVDYKQHHLNAPPSGYEWRSIDGNYVLAAAATGVIASVVIASAAH